MDGGFRSPRSGERRPERRPSLVQQPASPQNPTAETEHPPRPAVSQAMPDGDRRGGRRWPLILGLVGVAILIAGAAAWFMLVGQRGTMASSIDESKHQAVFLESGQIYFGKLAIMGDGHMRLTDVFYIQPSEDSSSETEAATTSSGTMKLVKLGGEVHGPEDEMIINPDKVLFFENLKTNSKVSERIRQSKSGGN